MQQNGRSLQVEEYKLKKQLDRLEKKIDNLEKKLDDHITKIWEVYEPIKKILKMFKR